MKLAMFLSAVLLLTPAQRAQSTYTTPTSSEPTTCRGERATLIVHSGEEETGGAERDVIVIIGNGATVYANGGDDLVCVYGAPPDRVYGHGNDVYGGPGFDTIITYGGDNLIQGDGDDDILLLNGDNEDAYGGDGNDHIWGLGALSLYADGEAGNDLIVGSPNTDWLYGGPGVDVLMGAGGNDALYGEENSDVLYGFGGYDTLDGGDDYDTCIDAADGADFISCADVVEDEDLPEAGGAPESESELGKVLSVALSVRRR